jgi:hypothetical protein
MFFLFEGRKSKEEFREFWYQWFQPHLLGDISAQYFIQLFGCDHAKFSKSLSTRLGESFIQLGKDPVTF